MAGPNCTSGTQDQIQARTGTEVLTGIIPTGYTFVDNATVSTTTSVTNNGELQLADGELIVGTGTTFTNSGSFDTTSANGILDGSTTTGSAFTTLLERLVHRRGHPHDREQRKRRRRRQ